MIDPQNFMKAPPLGWGSRLSAILIVVGALFAMPTGAYAQINPFQGYKGPMLSKEDLNSGRAAASKLLTEDEAQVGKSEDWVGPTSGNSGSIAVKRAFKQKEMECRALRSEIHYKKTPSSPPKVLNLNVCRIKTGEWKLM